MEIRNKKLGDDEFQSLREEVLAEWPTGKEVNLDEAIEFHKSLPPGRNWSRRMAEAREKGETLVGSGMGKSNLEEHLELLRYVQEEGHAEILATSPDSMTRVHRYDLVAKWVEQSVQTGKSALNGFPVVHYGVAGSRKIIETAKVPVEMRFSAADPRLICEIAFAGGHSTDGADGLHAYWEYNGKMPLDVVLRYHQYVERLAGYYEERGVPMLTQLQAIHATIIPPGLRIAAQLTQALMVAEQGVKNLMLCFQAQGNMYQDAADARVFEKLAREYLDRFGYKDVSTFLEATYIFPRYPQDTSQAFAVIAVNSIMARLCKAQVAQFRTVAEAKNIPTKESLAMSYKCARTAIDMVKVQRFDLDQKCVDAEAVMIEREARAITDRVIDLGDGDVAVGLVRAIESGVMDNPYATCNTAACKVIGVRDSEGAVRYLDHGDLPFSSDIVEFHKEKIAQRSKKEGREVDYDTVINDLIAMSYGSLM